MPQIPSSPRWLQTQPQTQPQTQLQPKSPWGLKTAAIVLIIGLSGVALSKLDQQHQQRQREQTLLVRLEMLKSTQDYGTCLSEAPQIPPSSPRYSQAQVLASQCRSLAAVFERAQALATAGQFSAAIAEVSTVVDANAQAKVNQLVSAWSYQTLQVAEGYYRDPNGRFYEAIQTAETITPQNALYAMAQSKIQAWQAEWRDNQTHWQSTALALYAQQPQIALSEAQSINHPYWQQQTTRMMSAAYGNASTGTPDKPQTAVPANQSQLDLANSDRANSDYARANYADYREMTSDSYDAARDSFWIEQQPGSVLLSLKFLLPLSLMSLLAIGQSRPK